MVQNFAHSPWIVCDADVMPFKLFNVNMYAKIMSNINVGSSIFIIVVAAIFLLEALVEYCLGLVNVVNFFVVMWRECFSFLFLANIYIEFIVV